MKAKDLIELLEGFEPDEEVYFLPSNSTYPEDFSTGGVRRHYTIRAFWGDDFKGTIIKSEGQVGSY